MYLFYGKLSRVNLDFHEFIVHNITFIVYAVILGGARILARSTDKLRSIIDTCFLLAVVFFLVQKLPFWIVGLLCGVTALSYALYMLFFSSE
jgi:hypothetical protein